MGSARIHTVKNPKSGVSTVYLDSRLLLQQAPDGTVLAFQVYDKRSERLINKLLAGTRYSVVDSKLVEYDESAVPISIKTAMEVLLERQRAGRGSG